MILSSTVLDQTWAKWAGANCQDNASQTGYAMSYSRISRRSKYAIQFENWLFTQGAVVCQINHKRQLQILDDQQASWFVLQHSL